MATDVQSASSGARAEANCGAEAKSLTQLVDEVALHAERAASVLELWLRVPRGSAFVSDQARLDGGPLDYAVADVIDTHLQAADAVLSHASNTLAATLPDPDFEAWCLIGGARELLRAAMQGDRDTSLRPLGGCALLSLLRQARRLLGSERAAGVLQ